MVQSSGQPIHRFVDLTLTLEHSTMTLHQFPTDIEPNNPLRAGRLASNKVIFGDRKRYALYAIHTRFGKIEWIVVDAETPDYLGQADVIRMADTPHDAVAGLPWNS